jgi:hypothetical protein
MRAACAPTGAMLNEMTLDVTQSVPEIQVDFSLPGESRTLVLTLERASLHVSGADVVAEAAHAWNEKAVILNADKSAIPAN